jgi:DNA invertase Pin-like site-specific DNA recombinase
MEEQGQVQIIKAKKLAKEVADSGRKLRVAAYCRVSTTSDEQIDSFNSQMTYYKTLIESNPNWVNAGIYADEGITGTAAEKRPDFMRMITDAMQGRIDVILVKSLSRFARNTVDTLNYVRALKEKKVYVRFEEEHIDTATEQGELLITVLSSVAQQEVQNTSEHVKKGLSMMMSKGDLVGFNSCLGYNYDEKTKKITINEKEAEIIRYIFKRYLEGIGTTVLARELGEHGWKTKYGSAHWCDSTILGILKNEKYKGDLLQGKTFTVDPITKKRLENRGESDKFYLTNHHEPIVSVDEWERANAMLQKRSYVRRLNPDGTRSRFSRTYPFSFAPRMRFLREAIEPPFLAEREELREDDLAVHGLRQRRQAHLPQQQRDPGGRDRQRLRGRLQPGRGVGFHLPGGFHPEIGGLPPAEQPQDAVRAERKEAEGLPSRGWTRSPAFWWTASCPRKPMTGSSRRSPSRRASCRRRKRSSTTKGDYRGQRHQEPRGFPEGRRRAQWEEDGLLHAGDLRRLC